MATLALKERFELLGEIGEGGFARVFKAREATTGRKVALKVLKDAYVADPVIVERFRREVFAVASISSPHVVGMYDFGISGQDVFIAMEFVEGPTLRELIYERAWTAREIHLVIGQIAQALAAAHRQNIVHRDLKPENVILVAGSGGTRRVKVLDFGLAKLAELERKLELEPLTRAGMCFGTPQYMAPELITGRPWDKSVDLYALGVIAFEMIAGHLPWDGADPREVLLKVVKEPAPHVMRAHPSIERPADVDRFLQRALAKDRAARPPDAAGFFRDFERALLGSDPPRRTAPVPAADAAFAGVWSADLALRDEGGDTQVDPGAGRFGSFDTASVTFTGPGRSGVRRRLPSGWLQSLGDLSIDVVEPPAGAAPLPDPPSGPAPSGHGFASGRREQTEEVRPARPRVLPWLIPLFLALVLVAGLLGYLFGRHSH